MIRTAFALCLCLALLGPASVASQVFSRTDDTRTAPPERRERTKRFRAEVDIGATLLSGNVDHFGAVGKLALSLKLGQRHELFVDGNVNHAIFDGDSLIDKDAGSLMYVLALAKHWNLYAVSTHSRNRFLQLRYRTTNSVGVCVHGFGPPALTPILLSLDASPELEWWKGVSGEEFTFRASARLNWTLKVNDALTFGSDLIYTPALSDFGDFRIYVEGHLEVGLWTNVLALRITLSDEYDSRPRPDVARNDVSLVPSLAIKFGVDTHQGRD